jgi:hypothetical protein
MYGIDVVVQVGWYLTMYVVTVWNTYRIMGGLMGCLSLPVVHLIGLVFHR